MFTASKAAQMAAVFAAKQDGTINVLKLTKLLYLADRESITRYGAPISYDNMVSMDHGPVLSRTLNLINGLVEDADAAKWEEWISHRENYDISVKRPFERKDLDELSDADLEVIEAIWSQFGKWNQWTIRDYIHAHCPEWKDPKGSSFPIKEKDVLIAIGRSPEEAIEIAQEIHTQRELDRVFSNLR